MAFESFQNFFLYVFVGTVLGFILTRYYYEKSKNYALGKTIEGIMISRNVEEILNLSQDLASVIEKIRYESDSLLEQIKKARDIEAIPFENDLIKNGNVEITLEDENLINMDKNSDNKEDSEKE